MAYMDQERKAPIAAALKRIIPKSWKWSLRVHHHSSLQLNIAAAPVDLIDAIAERARQRHNHDATQVAHLLRERYAQLNTYHMGNHFDPDSDLGKLFARVLEAMHKGNHDRSDIQSDYHDVGWYVYIHVGRWDKPFQLLEA